MNYRHFILTRAFYCPDQPLDFLYRRLELTRNLTIPSLASQTCQEFLWIIRANKQDPLLSERANLLNQSSISSIISTSGKWWDNVAEWLTDESYVLTTRLDDDDQLASDYIERAQSTANIFIQEGRVPQVFDFPSGHKLILGDSKNKKLFQNNNNQFISLLASVDSQMTVYHDTHRNLGRHAPVYRMDDKPAWIWTRHADSITDSRGQLKPHREAPEIKLL